MPARVDPQGSQGLYGRVTGAVGGLLGGQKRRTSMRGAYSSLGQNGQ